ncbi:NAD(P)/FAD-dependent oxidoreductase [Tuberibacillus sp. Marseille-P3662]|uniref:NAD(P)/FAD-dependent oxidoreductase n=1 Tax=Tuberibacillus sp. Marseille-P3662 TaxID=1965358 RepID=UPI000A1C9A94|nr:NAD(P)/FAD-dependent oxidoreductase [Tuberibacillus sp. Marseille-P3662]
MQPEKHVHDTIIIGGGTTGLFTAFYGGMRGMDIRLIESLPELGGQLAALYPEKNIYDVAGFPEIRAKDLVERLKEQALAFDPYITLNAAVSDVEKLDEQLFKVTTNQAVYYAKTVIITGGVGAFEPRRLQLDNAEQFEESSLFYAIQDIYTFANKKVVISGGGDSAIDWALALEPLAKEVSLVHRREAFRAHEQSIKQLHESTVKIKTPYMVKQINGESRDIKEIMIGDKNGTLEEAIDADALVVSHGFKSNLGPIKDWGLELDKRSIVVNECMETNIKGIYAAGDITTHKGKVKLIASGFGEAPTAISHAKTYIDPKSRTQPMHSTSLFG